MVGRLSQLLDPSRVTLQVRSDKRTAAIHEVASRLEGHPDVLNFGSFYQELLARERLDTTCLGNEIALPHARTEHVKKMVMSVGRSTAGVLFENSNETVRLLFVLGTPKSNPGDYLMVVSLLCKVLKSAATREALLSATTAEDFVAALVAAESALLAGAKS
ncbi:PTS sugar transporter subunit IIA [Nibricoccus sp. IMCC34717]|uniref:PTS sugar transporter subunit IIA n=1 Tax=Nibricoccus sp. IMCC34717 TaxID=3034021 RepID=UPI00384A9E6D